MVGVVVRHVVKAVFRPLSEGWNYPQKPDFMRIFACQRKPTGKPGYMLPKQARYQLRYTPMYRCCSNVTIISLWDQDVGGSSPFTPTIFLKDISKMSLRNIFNKQRMKGIEGER